MPQLNISVTVSAEAVTAVNVWRATQFLEDGTTPKYADNLVLARSILKDALKRILRTSPTANMQTELDSKTSADSTIEEILDGAVTD